MPPYFKIKKTMLKAGVNFLSDNKVIAYMMDDGRIRATKNICRHMSGKFKPLSKTCLRCQGHGWELNLETMQYENPLGGLIQPELIVEENADEVLFLEKPLPAYLENLRDKSPLAKGELTFTFFAHACGKFKLGEKVLFTDPWLIGPAFSGGWWLSHNPPPNWKDELGNADAIYISHNHSDHLNEYTLKELSKHYPSTPIYVPAFDNTSCEALIQSYGMKDVRRTEFHTWIELDDNTRFMILPDTSGKNDSGLMIEYKGHLILNNVDCGNLCGGHLPKDIDVLLSAFAGGSSGFPVCWDELYSEKKINQTVQKYRANLANMVMGLVENTQPETFIPIAGYFTEAHPADIKIKQTNLKNSDESIIKMITRKFPDVNCHAPFPGHEVDISDQSIKTNEKSAGSLAKQWDFERFAIKHNDDYNLNTEEKLSQIAAYFKNSGFNGDLLLHVLETEQSFENVLLEFFYDFKDHKLLNTRIANRRYLRMKVRSNVFHDVIKNGKSWEEISIGFQARFYREPDVYNFDFWNHFQNYGLSL